MRIGVNLLWLKPKAMGGVETFVKNLLRGFCEVDSQSEYVLFINGSAWQYLVSELNLPENFISVIKDWDPFNVSGMVVKQFIKINKLVAKYKVDVLYHPTPIYPIRKMKGIPQIATFHDLLFLHYPEYASFFQRLKYLWTWGLTLKSSNILDVQELGFRYFGYYFLLRSIIVLYIYNVSIHVGETDTRIFIEHGKDHGNTFLAFSSQKYLCGGV